MSNYGIIFIFGANDIASGYVQSLNNKGITISAILDNDTKKQGGFLCGIKIKSPSALREYIHSKIIVACRNFHQIVSQLIELGIDRDDIYLAPDELMGEQENLDLFINKNKNQILLIANGYSPFVQERVKKYNEVGLCIDVVEYQEDLRVSTVKTGDDIELLVTGKSGLLHLLRSKCYKKILIHFVSPNIGTLLSMARYEDAPIIIWCHGYEVLPWYRTWFIYSDDELRKQLPFLRNNDKDKRDFLKEWFKKTNINWVFVSNWECGRVKKWIGFLPSNYYVIPNYIDEIYFKIPLPEKDLVTNIISIKNHKNSIYANDVIADAIIELSQRKIFDRLNFTLYGFGELFDKNFAKLLEENFSNVTIIKRKLSSAEMRAVIIKNGLVLAPTRYDTHGVTVAEMMAAGRGVIVSSIPVMLELYDESCVSFSEGDNPYSLADEVEYLVNHRDEFIEKCKNGRERIRKLCGSNETIIREIKMIEKN